ncbi:zinc-ribbon domain-containing protein, partial [Escherichia coli]|uniref:zinc-ribbon domain-containing protein n=1 Tax=Escherichia coli TaxID=562 RepID=UPI00200AD902
MTVPDYTVKVRKWFCVMCDEDYEGEKCCPRCGTGVYSREGGAAGRCHERCNSDPHPTPEIRSRG